MNHELKVFSVCHLIWFLKDWLNEKGEGLYDRHLHCLSLYHSALNGFCYLCLLKLFGHPYSLFPGMVCWISVFALLFLLLFVSFGHVTNGCIYKRQYAHKVNDFFFWDLFLIWRMWMFDEILCNYLFINRVSLVPVI